MRTTDHFSAAELARSCAVKGVRYAVISPGSRSAPLVRAFHAEPSIRCLVIIDERSAAFFALGMAQQLGAPVALISTSGSAVLNYGPAIAEAFYQRVPLLVITADRPEEWVDQGEGQAIRQQGVLALHMRRSVQLPRDPHDDLARWHCGRLINEAIDATTLPVPGPVHVNVPLTEPLYESAEDPPAPSRSIVQTATRTMLAEQSAVELASSIANSQRVMVLAGQGLWSAQVKHHLLALASLPQVVVLSEATSNLDDPTFITCIDRVIQGVNAAKEEDLKPDVLITFGGAVVSKRIKGLLRKWRPVQHWNIDPGQRHYDTYQSLTHDLAVSAETFLTQWEAKKGAGVGHRDGQRSYAASWKEMDERMRERHRQIIETAPFCDLTVFNILMERVPGNSDVQLANSTPARYAQLFDRHRGLRFFSNRGTSGIDGCTSTAAGAAFASDRTTTLITGDIAFCYDGNAFWNAHRPASLRVIVIDNGGGNIFRFIEGPDRDEELLPYFETAHGRDPVVLARSFGLDCYEAFDEVSLEHGLDQLYLEHQGPAVLVVRTDARISPQVLREYFNDLKEDH